MSGIYHMITVKLALQWRIQDLTDVGVTPKVGAPTYYFGQFYLYENVKKV